MNAVPSAFPGTRTRLRAARWATRIQFAAMGFVGGIWGVHIPTAKAHYDLSERGLSFALLAAAAGAVTCLVFAGRLVSAFGARAVALVAGLVLCAALGVIIIPDSLLALPLLMFGFGGAMGLMDVSVNAEGSVLEAHSGKKVMSGFHAMFSAGGMAGAAAGSMLIAAGVAPELQLAGLGAVLAAIVAMASTFMLPVHPSNPEHESGYRLPRGLLAVLGLLAALGLVAEGAMYDWSVLYMQTQTAAAPALAALGFASFSAAMAATRFAGDWLRTHVSAPRLLGGSALLAAVAMAVVLLVHDPIVALVGFALVGVGFANMVPILFVAATKAPGVSPATAIAAVSSMGYLGFVAGPPLIGGLAHASSLSWALGVVVIAALLLAWGARRLPE